MNKAPLDYCKQISTKSVFNHSKIRTTKNQYPSCNIKAKVILISFLKYLNLSKILKCYFYAIVFFIIITEI